MRRLFRLLFWNQIRPFPLKRFFRRIHLSPGRGWFCVLGSWIRWIHSWMHSYYRFRVVKSIIRSTVRIVIQDMFLLTNSSLISLSSFSEYWLSLCWGILRFSISDLLSLNGFSSGIWYLFDGGRLFLVGDTLINVDEFFVINSCAAHKGVAFCL